MAGTARALARGPLLDREPEGSPAGRPARLLRAVAQEVEALGDAEVYDLVLHTEATARGPWYSVTVYYARADEPA